MLGYLARFGEGFGFYALFESALKFLGRCEGREGYITSPNFGFGRIIQGAKNENQVAESQLVGWCASFIDSMLHSFRIGESRAWIPLRWHCLHVSRFDHLSLGGCDGLER
jgi:hypothetical protein